MELSEKSCCLVSWRSVPANWGCFSSVETAPFFVKGQWHGWEEGWVREGRKGSARLDLRGERLRRRDEPSDEQVRPLWDGEGVGTEEEARRCHRCGRNEGKTDDEETGLRRLKWRLLVATRPVEWASSMSTARPALSFEKEVKTKFHSGGQ
jgi:hypothetical protein